MSWAEFVLRSIGFKEQREYQDRNTREVSYWSYRASMVFSKKRPLKINEFWPIGEVKKEVSISDELLNKFKSETAKWEAKSKKNG